MAQSELGPGWWAQYHWGYLIREKWYMEVQCGNIWNSCFKSYKKAPRPNALHFSDGEMKALRLETSWPAHRAPLPLQHHLLPSTISGARVSYVISSHPPLSPTHRTWRPCCGQLQLGRHCGEPGQNSAWFFSPRGGKAPPPWLPRSSASPPRFSVLVRHRIYQDIQAQGLPYFVKKTPFISAEKTMSCFQEGKRERSTLARTHSKRSGKLQTLDHSLWHP